MANNKVNQRILKKKSMKTLMPKVYKNPKSVTLNFTLWGGDGAEQNFRHISTIMIYINEIHQRVLKL